MSNEPYASDGANLPSRLLIAKKRPREVTGWMVSGLMVAFFAVVIGVNVFMAHAALSTFGGVETEAPTAPGRRSSTMSPWRRRRTTSIGRSKPR